MLDLYNPKSEMFSLVRPHFILQDEIHESRPDPEISLQYDILKNLLKKEITVDDLTENDIKPLIVQKTVDMKMGLDIALISTKKLADLLIIITGDADIVPALKMARREGMQVGLDPLKMHVRADLREHVDFVSTKVDEYNKEKGK